LKQHKNSIIPSGSRDARKAEAKELRVTRKQQKRRATAARKRESIIKIATAAIMPAIVETPAKTMNTTAMTSATAGTSYMRDASNTMTPADHDVSNSFNACSSRYTN
jgi:hypothetical protein